MSPEQGEGLPPQAQATCCWPARAAGGGPGCLLTHSQALHWCDAPCVKPAGPRLQQGWAEVWLDGWEASCRCLHACTLSGPAGCSSRPGRQKPFFSRPDQLLLAWGTCGPAAKGRALALLLQPQESRGSSCSGGGGSFRNSHRQDHDHQGGVPSWPQGGILPPPKRLECWDRFLLPPLNLMGVVRLGGGGPDPQPPRELDAYSVPTCMWFSLAWICCSHHCCSLASATLASEEAVWLGWLQGSTLRARRAATVAARQEGWADRQRSPRQAFYHHRPGTSGGPACADNKAGPCSV